MMKTKKKKQNKKILKKLLKDLKLFIAMLTQSKIKKKKFLPVLIKYNLKLQPLQRLAIRGEIILMDIYLTYQIMINSKTQTLKEVWLYLLIVN